MRPRGIEFGCYDVNSVLVTCSKSQWDYLVKHQEMIERQGVVKSIIESPDFICISARHTKRRTIYKMVVLPPPYGNTYVRVVVEYKRRLISKMRGYVINAFACNGMQEGEVKVWERG